MESPWLELREFFTGDGMRGGVRGLVVLILGIAVARLARRVAERLVTRRADAQSALVIGRGIYYGLIAVTLFSALREWGFDLDVLLGAAGILTVAIGFASQTSASNLISGIFLLFERPFVVGDTIRVGDTHGIVLSIDFMSVKLRTFDNLYVRVPNETLVKSTIVNSSHFPVRRFDLPIRIGLHDDFEAARRIIADVVEADPLILEEPRYRLFVQGFGESSLELQLSVWAVQERYFEMKDSFQIRIKDALQAGGIDIPMPHRVFVHEGHATNAPPPGGGPPPGELSPGHR